MQGSVIKNVEDADLEEKEGEEWAGDQLKHRYYYDDAHGYQEYDPDSDDENEESDETALEDELD